MWNVDESNLYIDAQREKVNISAKTFVYFSLTLNYHDFARLFLQVVAPRGEKASRVTATSGREAFTIEAAISAAGDVLEPLVVFKGVHAMSSWRNEGFKGRVAVSKNGWMTGDIFNEWFKYFAQTVTARPIILICDGHSSHLKYETLKLVRKMIKLTFVY